MVAANKEYEFWQRDSLAFLAVAGLPFKLFAKLKEVADVVCCADGFVVGHHQHQFKAKAQFISRHPMF
ncbi:MAG: hypothetical protein ABI472_25445 [Ginsengibacter sp.]